MSILIISKNKENSENNVSTITKRTGAPIRFTDNLLEEKLPAVVYDLDGNSLITVARDGICLATPSSRALKQPAGT